VSASALRVAVVDYGIGNLRSAQRALQHCGADARLVVAASDIAAADAVVLPGVGAFGACMAALRTAGLEASVLDAAASGRPFAGICVGMQMLFDASEESPGARGLGVIGGTIQWLGESLPRPHMQWNRLQLTDASDPLVAGLGAEPWVYFVHSLHAVPDDPSVVVATARYGHDVTAICRRGNVVAMQFHPEKSSNAGLAILGNWLRIAASGVSAPDTVGAS
jgi:glutamine amidotransferase